MAAVLALLHTSRAVIPEFERHCACRLSGVRTAHLLDESLLRDVIDRGRLDADIFRRVAALVSNAGRVGRAGHVFLDRSGR